MRRPNQYCTEWTRKFAWLPVDVNGITVWLESYEVRYVRKENECKCDVVGWWEYRTLQESIDSKVDELHKL